MTFETEIVMKYSDQILELIDEQPDMPRGDLQGVVEAIVMNIIDDIKEENDK